MSSSYYQNGDGGEDFIDVEDHESDPLMKGTAPVSFRIPDVAKVVILLGAAVVLSAVAISSTQTGFRGTLAISEMTSLDQLPEGTVLNDVSESNKQHLFTLYQKKFGKSYDENEYTKKLDIFKATLVSVDAKNKEEMKRGGSAKHGITKFSDTTEDELRSKLLKASKPKSASVSDSSSESASSSEDEDWWLAQPVSVAAYTGSDTAVDWSGTYTTAIRDQGYCGSCWAFSTASQVESDAIRSNLLTTSDYLSVQQLVSCDKMDAGCNGGYTELGFNYVSKHGLETQADYPYTSYQSVVATCAEAKATNKMKVRVSGYYGIENEDDMINYVLSTGPLSICVSAATWFNYLGGVMSACSSAEEDVDHCVQLVGVNVEEGYWKIRNTWGTDWGEEGYIRVSLGSNTCGVATDPIYTTVFLENVGNDN